MTHNPKYSLVVWTAVAVLIVSSLVTAQAIAEDEFVLRNAVGTIEIGRGRPFVWTPASEKTTPRAGDRIRTGARSKVEVAWGNQRIRLYENSVLRLPDVKKSAGIERGHSLIDVFRKNGKPSPFEISADDVVVVVKGTRFGVDRTQGESVNVAVYEGEVALHDRSDKEAFPISVRPGYRARMGGGLTPMVALNSGEDPWSAWESKVPAAPSVPPAAAAPGAARDAVRAATRDAIRSVERRSPVSDLGGVGDGLHGPVEIDPVQDAGNPGEFLGGGAPGKVGSVTPPIGDND